MKRLVLALAMAAALLLSSVTVVSAASEEDIEASIVSGLEWLATQQNADGSWGTGDRVAVTGFAVLKMEDRAIELGYDTPFVEGYEYSENVQNGLDYIFSKAVLMDTDGVGGADALYFADSKPDYHHWVYETSVAMMAIGASTTPDRVVTVPGPVNGWTYKQVEQYALNYLIYAQRDDGGWGYGASGQLLAAININDRSDNSGSGYAVLGLIYAQNKFGLTIPNDVTSDLDSWITTIQNTDGGSGYTSASSWVNILKTGNLLFEMAMVSDDSSTPRAQAAVQYIENHWNDANWDPGWKGPGSPTQNWPHYQAMYTTMKGFESMGIELLDLDGDNTPEHDWFGEFSTAIVNTQNADGSWNADYWGNNILATEWALLTLERVVEIPTIQVYIDIKPSSCPNPINTKSNGLLPVAILGTYGFDVTTIDPASIRIKLDPETEGVAPVRGNYEDVATPFEGELCDCHDLNGDGFMDLTLKFKIQEIVEKLGLSGDEEEPLKLTITGNLKEEFSGTAIEGQDCVWVLEDKKKK